MHLCFAIVLGVTVGVTALYLVLAYWRTILGLMGTKQQEELESSP